ncbi:YIP1 family protein [Paenibacillus yanchengensis]|uniref:YIP1 family protein n=1 Tax=Paenibacillus yanchengensis TaxID=2035833 RepID=A0ABW4YHL8_9BACL
MLRKMKSTRLLPGLLVACLLVVMFPATAFAEYPYSTNYRTSYGTLVWTQAAYAPDQVLGRNIFVTDPENPEAKVLSPLQQPSDLFIDKEDQIYVADTGNNRIVIFDENGEFDRILPPLENKPLSGPKGLYVDENRNIFVADTGNSRVVKLGQQGELLQEYTLPDSRFIPDNYRFEPIKVAVDKRGFVYIVSLGSYNGLLQLDSDGGFVRFFAANKAPFSFLDSMKRMIYSKEMYEKQLSKLPPAIANVNIDKRGFIYTVSYGSELKSEQVKKLNNAGKDFLGKSSAPGGGNKKFGEYRFRSGTSSVNNLKDIAVDATGNFSVIDGESKMVSQYDAFGNLLFFWSGDASPNTTQLGIVKSPSAIEINSKNHIYILDDNANLIQSFRQTEFGEMVYTANNLTLDGKYKEAEPLWQQVLHYNAHYTPAMVGLAQSAFQKGDYEEAQRLYLAAGLQEGYSDSFWQLRLNWLQERFALIMNIIVVIVVLYLIFKFIKKRKPDLFKVKLQMKGDNKLKRLGEQLRHGLYLMRHPIDGFTAIRYENKGSYWSGIIILLLAFVSYALSRSGTSFVFNADLIKPFNLFNIFIQFFLLWTGFVICNYLVSSILRGEGRFKDVFIGSAYSLIPLIIIGLPLTLISNGMTLSEEAIYSFLNQGMFVWVALLIIWQVKSLQNYSVSETVVNLLYTIGTMIIIAVICFIVIGLGAELRNFIYSIIQEVSVR